MAHRGNNVVKVGFYQTNKEKSKNNEAIPYQLLEIISVSDSENDTDEDEDELVKIGNNDREHNQKGKGDGKNNKDIESCTLDYSTIKLSEIPSAALNVLKTTGSCKSLIRYIKKVINKQI